MTWMTDQKYLRAEQYRQSDRLGARMRLHERYGTNPYEWQHWVRDQLDLRPGMRLLELGCGPASLWRKNLDRIPAGMHLTLTDASRGMATEAASAVQADDRFAAGNVDAQALPFAAETFDVVVANHMLYHVPDLPRAVAEIGRVLRPGGWLCAATNGELHMKVLHDLIHQVAPGYVAPVELRLFNLENGPAKLSPVFQRVEVRQYQNSLWVTEVQPLVEYVASMGSTQQVMDPERLAKLADLAQKEIDAAGGIRINNQTGLLLAHKF